MVIYILSIVALYLYAGWSHHRLGSWLDSDDAPPRWFFVLTWAIWPLLIDLIRDEEPRIRAGGRIVDE